MTTTDLASLVKGIAPVVREFVERAQADQRKETEVLRRAVGQLEKRLLDLEFDIAALRMKHEHVDR